MILDGIWDFHFELGKKIGEVELASIEFEEFAAVPGCFDATMLHLNKRGCGIYRKKVQCGGKCKLELDGIGLSAKLLWDRKEIAEIETAFSHRVIRFDAGADGTHELLILCSNMVDKSLPSQFCHYYDFYGYGGIYRSVSLSPVPEFEVEHLKISTLDALQGKIQIEAEMAGKIPEDTTFFIDGKPAGKFSFEENKAICTLNVPQRAPWSPEHPELHKFSFCDREITFGIRTIETKNGKLLLNGKALHLRGTCRHDSHPEFGYALPESVVLNDLLSIRDHGFNCIRGSHYPQSQQMLALCDKIGLMVWDETLGWQNTVEAMLDPEFERRQLQQVSDIVRSAENHPCVILWGFLNEAIASTTEVRPFFARIVEAYHRADPTRPVTYATMLQDRDQCCDLCDVLSFNIYPGWYHEEEGYDQEFRPDSLYELFGKISRFADRWPEKPMLVSEIGAESQPGNHSGVRWSEEYQRDLLLCALAEAEKNPRCSGLFVWLYSDARTYSNAKAQERCGGFNCKGMVDAYRRPKLSYAAVKKLLTGKEK